MFYAAAFSFFFLEARIMYAVAGTPVGKFEAAALFPAKSAYYA